MMSKPPAELNPGQFTPGVEDDSPFVEDLQSETIETLHETFTAIPAEAGPWSDTILSWIIPDDYQQVIQPELLDPSSFRFECPFQSVPCQPTYQDFHVETQLSQTELIVEPGPSYSNHHDSASEIWSNKDPVFSNIWVDFHNPVPMADMQYQQQPTEVVSHITQTVMYDIVEGGQVLLDIPHEAGPTYLTLESAEVWQHNENAQAASVLETTKQHPKHHQTACSLYECRVQKTNNQPLPSSQQPVGAFRVLRSKKPCHCTRSRCLKLYCECFAKGEMCSNCDCTNCHNNEEHEMKRHEAIKLRNPNAFKSKALGWSTEKAKSRSNKRCNCKRSGCLKNYCECYEANIQCTSVCNCVGCLNHTDNSQVGAKQTEGRAQNKCPQSVLTRERMMRVCGCLLARAKEAEREARTHTMAQHLVLAEFGHHLLEIVKAMFNYSPH